MAILNQAFTKVTEENGDAIQNAELRAYISGTTTPTPIYSDSALTIPHSQPVFSDAEGVFPSVFYNPAISTRVIYKKPNGTVIDDIDPINEGLAALPDGSVTTPKLAAQAVTTDKLADQSVSTAKMASMPAYTILANDDSTSLPPQTITATDTLSNILGPLLTGTIWTCAYSAADVASLWLVCDGRAISRTTYARLFAKIGTTWGSGDGSTTFTLPDFRNEFLRGADRDEALAVGHEVGTYQDDAFQGHRHQHVQTANVAASGSNAVEDGSAPTTTSGVVLDPITDGTNGTPRTDSETRPRNAAVDFVIFI